jgi:superfamily II DNA or RNA helicase
VKSVPPHFINADKKNIFGKINIMEFDAACLRRVSNWSFITKDHKFDKKSFNKDQVLEDIERFSPKVNALLNNIKEIDEKDMKTHGKLFKHFIFSEVKQGGYGVKVITAALIASGFRLGYDNKIKLLSDEELLKNKGKNILLLSSTAVFDNAINVKAKKAILSKYNQRPENVEGDLARIILLDSGFKEGIDLFDVKYVHIFEPQTSKADQKQAIGRATRLCGQKGLEFHPKFGWPLEVFMYDVSLPSSMASQYDASTMFKFFLNHSGIDLRKLEFAEELEKYAIVAAVDYELTKNVHRFKLEDDEVNMDWLSGGAGKKKRPETVMCDKKCSARPTKDVPVSLPLFIAILFANDMNLPDLRKSNPRQFFCQLLKTDAEFCKETREAWKDPVKYVQSHKEQIMMAISMNKQRNLPGKNRQPFLKFVYTIIPRKLQKPANAKQNTPVNATNTNTNAKQNTPVNATNTNIEKPLTPKTQSENIPLTQSPKKVEPVVTDDSMSPKKIMNFLEIRQHVRDNFLQYTWPKVKLENLCVPKGGSELVKFTPTQDFIRNFYTPESAYKGMLLWHSVGTGKTCCAIATATSSFEKEGYTILWVTRTTLKSDIYKNMFDQVCSLVLQEKMQKGEVIPEGSSERLRLLSGSWKIKPMSYKQFSNLVAGKNKLYEDLVAINGKEDPLKKTLLIIDEAHKLYGGADLSSIERPDMGRLHKAIMTSYEKSGKDSVRLLMMTATPITNDPMELVKLVNLCRESKDQLKDEYDEFAKDFLLDATGKFTKKGSRKFLDSFAGYVSYLSREKDARQFSQPIITNVNAPLSESGFDSAKIENIKEQYDEKISSKKGEVDDILANFNGLKKQIADQKKTVKGQCKGLKKDAKQECLEIVQQKIDELNDELFAKKNDLDSAKAVSKQEIKQLKAELKATMKKASEDRSQQGIIENKCLKKEKKKKGEVNGNVGYGLPAMPVPSSSKSNTESIKYSP